MRTCGLGGRWAADEGEVARPTATVGVGNA